MPRIIIKYFFIFLCAIVTHQRLLHQTISRKSHRIFLSFFCIILSIATYLLKEYYPFLTIILPLLFLWIGLSIFSARPKVSLVTTVLSYCISCGMFLLSSCIILIFFTPLYYNTNFFPYDLFVLISGTLETFFVRKLFHIKRFRNGMPFLSSTSFINAGFFICLVSLSLLVYLQAPQKPPVVIEALILITLSISILVIIFWWEKQLIKSYRAQLQILELESLRKELEAANTTLSELKKQNTELGRLIHQDNKLLPAMENAVYEYLTSEISNQEEAASRGHSLLLELRNMSENRQNFLDCISMHQSQCFSTGITALDALLSYMQKQAHLKQIDFSTNISLELTYFVPSVISSEDLVRLLADLIENAIIATTNCAHRKIQLQIYLHRNIPVIELSDSGIPFEVASLINIGHRPFTTHAESGGSGIGLMDIWKIKTSYNASLQITEYEKSNPFSKKITFLFDNKNQYLITTWRCEEIIPFVKRTDMYIISCKNQS